jgi:hypothetical protein
MATNWGPTAIWLGILGLVAYSINVGQSHPTTANYQPPPIVRIQPVPPPALPAALPVPRSTSAAMKNAAVPEPSSAPSVAPETPEPPTATELGGGDLREVTASALNVRGTPSANSVVLTKLGHGQHVSVVAEDEGWALLALPDGRFGWVNGDYLGHLGSGDALPAPRPTPPITATATTETAGVTPVVPPTSSVVVPRSPGFVPSCSETGSCYGDISKLTGMPKTTFVHGYFRKNGTYVGSYFRSHR